MNEKHPLGLVANEFLGVELATTVGAGRHGIRYMTGTLIPLGRADAGGVKWRGGGWERGRRGTKYMAMRRPFRHRMLRYVTTNPGKVREAREYLQADVEPLEYDYLEIQADDLEPVAARGARDAYRYAGEPVIVDDSGLFVEALGGFPGPYSSYVEARLGVERVSRLVRREDDRRASFRCVVGYCDGEAFEATPEPVDRGDPGERRGQDLAADERSVATADDRIVGGDVPVRLFGGVVPGRIVEPRGDGGFGYDPIFEHDGTTFAELSPEEKNAVSHRGRALAKFAEWYADR